VPTYVISPFSPVGQIATDVCDHASILKLASWRWGLKSVSPRHDAAKNPAEFLDFSAPNLHTGNLPVVIDPGPHLCTQGQDDTLPTWPQNISAAKLDEWPALALEPSTHRFISEVYERHGLVTLPRLLHLI
jgi:hypothetical protein